MSFFKFSLSVIILSLLGLEVSAASSEIYVCEAEDPIFLGTYTASGTMMDGVEVFTNSNDFSFFRNNGFWYIGNLAPWPPETHYRCVEPEGCNFGEPYPPATADGKWAGSKKFNRNVVPFISNSPCVGNEEL